MDRREEIMRALNTVDQNNRSLILKLVDDMLFLENQLDELRQLPQRKSHPKDPKIQKQTEAGKMYKDCLNQYTNIVRTLTSMMNRNDASGDESPLRAYFKRINK